MKRLRRWSSCLAAVFVLFALAGLAAEAQVERAPRIGIIDVQAVLRESAAVRSLSQKIERQHDAAQDAVRDREAALREADSDLAQRRASLSPEEYTRERERLESEGVELQRQMQEERRQLDQMFSQGMARVQHVLQAISQDIARENELDLILAKTTVIIVRPELDFTDEALQRLNAQLPDVAVPDTQN